MPPSLLFITLMVKSTTAYSRSARKTMKMETTRYVSIAFRRVEATDGALALHQRKKEKVIKIIIPFRYCLDLSLIHI